MSKRILIKAMRFSFILATVLIVGIVILFAANYVSSHKAYLSDHYYNDFKSVSSLENKYAARGTYSVSSVAIKSNNKDIDEITVWYPDSLVLSMKKWPVVLNVNASNTRARNIKPFLERLASWGFIVVGNEDSQTGTGETTAITLDSLLNVSSDCVLFGKLDYDNIGIIGFSQGGAGAINAATRYENSKCYKTIFTGSAAYDKLSKAMGWEYDIAKITIPYFMCSGTGASDDSGNYAEGEFAGVSPLFAQRDNYNGITADVFKVRGRIIGAEHGDMLSLTDGYMTAWLLYQLKNDKKAGAAFIGENADILNNNGWTDVEKNM